MSTQMPTGAPPGVPESLITPQGNVPAIGIPNSQDYARLIFAAPYFEQIPIAEIIQPSVTEAVENVLPSLVPPYVDNAVLAGIQQYAVLLTGSTMSGPLNLSPLMPTADSMAATKAYVDTMLATAGIPEVPPVPSGQIWARETGQWVPISQAEGTFLPLSGGTMAGGINMSGNTITNMAAVPAMPNGAAPAQWVLNQIASVSLYQGTWNADTNVPDLTQLSLHVNGYTWFALTSSPSGVVISEPIPGLQGLTIYNGDTIIYSTVQGEFSSIHAGGLTLPEADARYVQLGGSQMSGALLLNSDATQNMQAVTFQQLEAAVANVVTPDAPADGQGYLRVGVGTNRWVPGLPIAGGILTGALTLSGNAVASLNAVPLQQLTSTLGNYVPLAGNVTITGPLTMGIAGTFTLAGNAATNLQAVPLQQLTSTLANYATQTQLNNAPYVPQNCVDNSGFTVNQRGYTSGTPLAANGYGFDRWKAGSAGATLNFTATPASTILTIAAGSVQQVIEGSHLLNASFTLSWTGSATGRVYLTSGTPGAYAASPITFTASNSGSQTIEFTGGTLGQVQLQLGSVATPWQPLAATVEQSRCERYFIYFNNPIFGSPRSGNDLYRISNVFFPTTMRVAPTVTLIPAGGWTAAILADAPGGFTFSLDVGDDTSGVQINGYQASTDL